MWACELLCNGTKNSARLYVENKTGQHLDMLYFHTKDALSDFRVSTLEPASMSKVASLGDIADHTIVRGKTTDGALTPPIEKAVLKEEYPGCSNIVITIERTNYTPHALTATYSTSLQNKLLSTPKETPASEKTPLLKDSPLRTKLSKDGVLKAHATSQRSQEVFSLFPMLEVKNLHKIVQLDDLLTGKKPLDYCFSGTTTTITDVYRLIFGIDSTIYSRDHVERAYKTLLLWYQVESEHSKDKDRSNQLLLLIHTARDGLIKALEKRPAFITADEMVVLY